MEPEILLALWGEGSEEEPWPLPALLPGESCPSSPHPDADNSVPLRMSLMPFELLPQR